MSAQGPFFINLQLMSALASLEKFGEEDLVFINWRSCRNCLQNEWSLEQMFEQKYTPSWPLSSKLYHQGHVAPHAPLWARIAQNVKKPPLTVNVMDFDFSFVSIWVPWSPLGPKKSWYIGSLFRFIRCREKQGAFCSILKLSLQSLYTFFGLFWRLAL